MKLKQILINMSLLLLLHLQGIAQSDTLLRQDDQQQIATELAKNLKQGTLVVSLSSKSRNIAAYREAGLDKVANQIEEELRAENERIVESFVDYYEFSNVLFISNIHLQDLLSGARSGIFLNPELKVDSSIIMPDTFFLIAERGPVKQKVYVDNRDPSKGFTYDDNTTINDALVMHDMEHNQLFAPFPYYITVPMKDDKFYVAVKKLDARLVKLLE
jgi:hypothetical protein